MPNFDNNWLPTDYDGVIKLLEGASNGYDVPVEVKTYGCFEKKHSFDGNSGSVIHYLDELRDGNQLDEGIGYKHAVASENRPHIGQNVDASGIYQHIIAGKKRYDQVQTAHPVNHRQVTGTETHTIRIIKNKLADTIEFLGELIEYEKPIAVGEEGRIEITYKLQRYELAQGSCAGGACAFE